MSYDGSISLLSTLTESKTYSVINSSLHNFQNFHFCAFSSPTKSCFIAKNYKDNIESAALQIEGKQWVLSYCETKDSQNLEVLSENTWIHVLDSSLFFLCQKYTAPLR